MQRYLTIDHADVETITGELFEGLGATVLHDAITAEGRENLLSLARECEPFYTWRKRNVPTGVVQEMRTFYLEEERSVPFYLEEKIASFLSEYDPLYQRIGAEAGFTFDGRYSVGFHHYPVGSAGITPHLDYTVDFNLIASFVLSGDAPFGIAQDRQGNGSVDLHAPAGSVILMRAARNDNEQSLRPFHYLRGPMEEERYAMLVRVRECRR